MNHAQVTQGLADIGASWSGHDRKYSSINDPIADQVKNVKTYHVHPQANAPHSERVLRFHKLGEIAVYIRARKRGEIRA